MAEPTKNPAGMVGVDVLETLTPVTGPAGGG